MKEIKFRAWDKNKRKMLKAHSIHMGTKKIIVSDEYGNYSLKFDEIELMQYIGLKDKNGIEIYEGDILKVIYSDFKGETHDTKYTFKDISDYNAMMFLDLANEIEVIYNIYEKH